MKVSLIVCVLFFYSILAEAQNPAVRNASGQAAPSAVASSGTEMLSEPDRLIRAYRFDEAIARLQKEMATAKRKKASTALLEEEMQRARTGATMLEATEKVVFIDSVSIDKDAFLTAFRLSPSIGKVGRTGDVFPESLLMDFGRTGQTIFLNDFGDKAYMSLPDSSGYLRLHTSYRMGETWTKPELVPGIANGAGGDGDMDFPFLQADGVTLYYAAQADGGLGGYDIYVTRYNSDIKQFVRPENVGMPFNSPYNDYLYIVDEETGVGWFVSDRYQSADRVCVYSFIPNESREIYDLSTTDEEMLRQFAMLQPFARSRGSNRQIEDAHARLSALQAAPAAETEAFRFVMTDNAVYTSLSDFRSASARLIASQWAKSERSLRLQEAYLDNLRRQYAAGTATPELYRAILELEKEVDELARSVVTMEKNMRQAELAGK